MTSKGVCRTKKSDIKGIRVKRRQVTSKGVEPNKWHQRELNQKKKTKKKKISDIKGIWTLNLRDWNPMRYRCAMTSLQTKSERAMWAMAERNGHVRLNGEMFCVFTVVLGIAERGE